MRNNQYRAAAVGSPSVFPSTQPILYRIDRLDLLEQGWFFFLAMPDVIYSQTFNGSFPAFASWARFKDRRNGQSFRVINLHTDYRSRSNRLQSVELVAERIAPWINQDETVILMGDLNARQGVETKIILGCEPPELDEVLIRNIVKARHWFEAIKRGETFAEIASREGTSKRWVQDVIDLAFLAPDILKQVISGTLPIYVTSDFLIKQGVSGRWSDQRNLMAENPNRSNAA